MTPPINIEQLKREARRASKADTSLTYMQHLERKAQALGFKTYAALRKAVNA